MVVHMIAIGEESGSLDFMLSKIADFYDDEVDAAIASLTAAIEPIMIVSLGFVVGFIVIAMFMPLVDVISKLSAGDDRQVKGKGLEGKGEREGVLFPLPSFRFRSMLYAPHPAPATLDRLRRIHSRGDHGLFFSIC